MEMDWEARLRQSHLDEGWLIDPLARVVTTQCSRFQATPLLQTLRFTLGFKIWKLPICRFFILLHIIIKILLRFYLSVFETIKFPKNHLFVSLQILQNRSIVFELTRSTQFKHLILYYLSKHHVLHRWSHLDPKCWARSRSQWTAPLYIYNIIMYLHIVNVP